MNAIGVPVREFVELREVLHFVSRSSLPIIVLGSGVSSPSLATNPFHHPEQARDLRWVRDLRPYLEQPSLQMDLTPR